MAQSCKTNEIWRDGFCRRKSGAPKDISCNINLLTNKKRTKSWCDGHKKKCSWVPGACQSDIGTKGEQGYKWIKEKGKLTRVMKKAGIPIPTGAKVTDKLTQANCKTLGNWMFKNVSKWNEKGKNPKNEGRGMISVLSRRKDISAARKKRIDKCADIITAALRPLPPTPRK
jgi:hypothetical protein